MKKLDLHLSCLVTCTFPARAKLQRLCTQRSKVYGSLVFNQLRSQFGGRLRLCMVTGGALLPESVDFLRAVLMCPVVEGELG